MNRFPRFVIGFIVAIVIFMVFIHYAKVPRESYLPPPLLYADCTATAAGTVTKTEEQTLVNHILEGQDTYYYVDYSFVGKPISAAELRRMSKKATGGAQGSSAAAADQEDAASTNNPAAAALTGTPANTYTGSVRVDQSVYDAVKPGSPVWVRFDPLAPQINGVQNTFGVWSRTTGYLNPYLWWYIGVIFVAFIVQELIRMATRTNDLR